MLMHRNSVFHSHKQLETNKAAGGWLGCRHRPCVQRPPACTRQPTTFHTPPPPPLPRPCACTASPTQPVPPPRRRHAHLDRPVVTASHCEPPVRADLCRAHPVGVSTECEQEVLAGQRPHLKRVGSEIHTNRKGNTQPKGNAAQQTQRSTAQRRTVNQARVMNRAIFIMSKQRHTKALKPHAYNAHTTNLCGLVI